MKDLIIDIFKNKKICILGYGREGSSSLKTILKYLPDADITVSDSNDKLKIDGVGNNVKIVCGNNYASNLNSFDIIMKSPGIPEDVIKDIDSRKITSQTDLFLIKYHSQVIGVTGTKGKTTTTSLIYHIFKDNGYDSILLGNIGIPAFNVIDNIKPDSVLVMELSAHQLNYIHVSPHISILLNLFEEHLDHFGTFDKYIEAKKNIFKYTVDGDKLILGRDLFKDAFQLCKDTNVTIIDANSFDNQYYGKIFSIDDITLKGEHNLRNIIIAITAVKSFLSEKGIRISDVDILSSIKSFKPLPHRLEYVGYFKGIHFYNDSISTIPESAIAALKALKDVDTIILGGFYRGIDYNSLVDYLFEDKVLSNIICLGDAGSVIFNLSCNHMRYGEYNDIYNDYIVEDNILKCHSEISNDKIFYNNISDLESAVNLSFEITQTNKSCLLSPAAASYDNFKNFEERGEMFIKYIKSY